MRVHEESCQFGPSGRVIKVFKLRVRDGGRKSQENASLTDLVWVGIHEGEKELVAELDGIEELVRLLASNKLNVLLKSELELEIALCQDLRMVSSSIRVE